MTNRVILLASGAALIVVALTVLVTVAIVGGDGSGGEGADGEGLAGQNPEPAGPPSMSGEWAFRVAIEPDDPDYTISEDAVYFVLDLYQDENGYLYADEEGPGWLGQEDEPSWTVSLRTGEGSVVRPDGATGLVVSGDGDDYDDRYSFELDGDFNGDHSRVTGDAEGLIYVEVDESSDSAGGYATSFEAWPHEEE